MGKVYKEFYQLFCPLTPKTGIVKKSSLEKLYDKYKEEAIASSLLSNENKSTEQIITARLNEVEKLINDYPAKEGEPIGLKKERRELEALLEKKKDFILNLESITEDNAIRNDIVAQRANKHFIKTHLGKYNVYKDRDDGSIFQIAIFHPNFKEKITGADLVYEQYDIERKKVRIAAIQYKIWDRRALYFSQARNAFEQIKKLQACFCKNHFCKDGDGNNCSKDFYRLPFCTAFLRPTDKLQNPKVLFTSGYHLPICKIEQLKEDGYSKDVIRYEQIRKSGLNAYTFEELFNNEMLGSRWLDIRELEDLYQEYGVFAESENIIIHAQDLSVESKRYLLNY